MSSQAQRQFVLSCTDAARSFLLREGTDLKYGARHLKRAIERHLVFPLSNLIATRQIGMGDVIKVDLRSGEDKLVFVKERPLALGTEGPNVVEFTNRRASPATARVVATETHVASRN